MDKEFFDIDYYKHICWIFLILLVICVYILAHNKNNITALEDEIKFLDEVVEAYKDENTMLREDIQIAGYSREYWKQECDRLKEEIKELKSRDYVGEFKVTWYTAGPESTGKTPDHPEYGITATGTEVTPGQTIAADWNVLPPGTKVYIEGIGERIVEDSGGAVKGKHVDVYIPSVEEANKRGVSYAKVYILEEES